jgi:hypothetical protein
MSSVRPLQGWSLPALPAPAPRVVRRVAVVAVAVLLILASLLAVSGRLPFAPRATAPGSRAPELAAARARAVARARTRANAPPASTGNPTPTRVAAATLAGDLFATHSWYVAPPPPPPPAPVAPPPPTAPPFPYAFLGSYAPAGEKAVFFLSRADRVTDARVGDRIDGVYEFESADDGQLVFNYLPLNIRQTVTTGAPQ